MWMNDQRTLLLRALLFDWLGQVLILAFILFMPKWTGIAISGQSLFGQGSWLVFVLLLYPLLGWLFGSYTVLRWRRLSLAILLQRLLITAIATLVVVAIARWMLNPNDTVWLVHRRLQFLWIGMLTVWAFAVRVGLGRVCWCVSHLASFCWLSLRSLIRFFGLGVAFPIARVCYLWTSLHAAARSC